MGHTSGSVGHGVSKGGVGGGDASSVGVGEAVSSIAKVVAKTCDSSIEKILRENMYDLDIETWNED